MFDVTETVFKDPEFKEDSVREEIVVPILKRLGFSADGDNRIVRSRSLAHPFVMIGSKRNKINIIPDYLLEVAGYCGAVLDAKSPSENLIKSKHAEQAYSYAIHPEVRSRYYSLCNGQQLVIYDVRRFRPVLEVDFKDIDRRWDQIYSLLGPSNLSEFFRTKFDPDLGMAVQKYGNSNTTHLFPFARINNLTSISGTLFTATQCISFGEIDYAVTFDFSNSIAAELFRKMHDQDSLKICNDKIESKEQYDLIHPIDCSIEARLGTLTQGVHEDFIPFDVLKL